jgi:hypothetical protein
MSRSIRVDDLAIITIDGVDYPLIITSITPDNIIAGNYTLISTDDGWKAQNYTTPHTVRFEPYREQLLSGTEDVDRLILLDLDYQSLLRACSTDQYTNKICQDDFFWRQKVERDMGHEVMINKLPEMSYRDQYRTLINGMDKVSAIKKGRLDYLIFRKIELDRYDAKTATGYGWINILKYAADNGVPLGDTANIAAANGNINVLEWLRENYDTPFDTTTINDAAERGQIKVLEWLYEKGIRPDDDHVFLVATIEGHEDVIEWLLNHDIIPANPHNVANNAALNDDVDMLNFLETKGIFPDDEGFSDAVEGGHRDAVRWLIDRNIISTNPTESANVAVGNRDIDMLELLESRGILPDENGANAIIEPTRRKIVRWLAERGIYPN